MCLFWRSTRLFCSCVYAQDCLWTMPKDSKVLCRRWYSPPKSDWIDLIKRENRRSTMTRNDSNTLYISDFNRNGKNQVNREQSSTNNKKYRKPEEEIMGVEPHMSVYNKSNTLLLELKTLSNGNLLDLPRWQEAQTGSVVNLLLTGQLLRTRRRTWTCGLPNRLCQTAEEEHWGLLKRVLRYIKGTLDYGLHLSVSTSTAIHVYSDFDWAGCSVNRKSTSGYAVFLGTNLISWVSRKKRTIARSSTEAEYKGLADVATEVTWVISLLREVGLHTGEPTTLWCDNLGATYLVANPVFHARTKHAEID